MASAGCRNETGAPSTSSSPPSGRRDPASTSNSSSWPCPSRAASPRTSPARSSKVASLSRAPTRSSRAMSLGVVGGTRAGRTGPGAAAGPEVLGAVPEHERDDPVLGSFVHVDHADGLAFAQDRGPIAHRRDLDESVGDEDDAAIRSTLVPDDVQHPLGQIRRQGRGHLVEHQDVGLDRQRARQVDHAQRGQRQIPRHIREIQVADAQLGEPVTEGFDGGLGQPKVRPDVQVRDDGRLLVDGDDPALSGLRR